MTDCLKLEEIEQRLFLKSDPHDDVVPDLEECILYLRGLNNEHEVARALVLLASVKPEVDESLKAEVRAFYNKQRGGFNILKLIEGAHAHCVFEEGEQATAFVTDVQDILDFYPKVVGIKVQIGANLKEVTKLVCSAKSDFKTSVPSDGISKVDLAVDAYDVNPEHITYLTPEDEYNCTSLLSDYEYLVLLLLSAIEYLSGHAGNKETVLAYLNRIIDTKEFDKIHWTIQEQALYLRTLLDIESVPALERGVHQLAKIAEFLPKAQSLGSYISCLDVITWQEIDSACAQRLLGMGDYPNALKYLLKLDKPLPLAKCYVLLNRDEEALKILTENEFPIELKPEALMLAGSISSDPKYWTEAWNLSKVPEAKFRLYEYCLEQGKDEEAPKHLYDVLEVYPSNFKTLSLLGQVLINKEKWEEAVSVLKRAVAADDTDYQSWVLLATAFVHAEKPELGLQALKQAIRVNQNEQVDPSTWSNYIALCVQLEKWDDVILGFSSILNQDIEKTADSLKSLTGCYIRLVEHFLQKPFEDTRANLQFTNLVSEFRNVVADDDPLIARLTGKVLVWAGKKDEGMVLLAKAFESVAGLYEQFPDEKTQLRVQLYFKDFEEAAGSDEKYKSQVDEFRKKCISN